MSQDDLNDISRRLRAVEQDAAAARVIGGAADRDLSKIRSEISDFRQATTASFNALRADFVDLRQDVNDLRQDVNDLRQDFSRLGDHVDRGFIEMRGKFDATAAGQQQIIDLIQGLIDGEDR